MKNSLNVISLVLLLSSTSQIFPADLLVEKTQEPKTEQIIKKEETKKEKRARLKKEKKATKQEKKLKLKQEKKEAKKNKPKRSLGKKIAIGVAATAGIIVTTCVLFFGACAALFFTGHGPLIGCLR